MSIDAAKRGIIALLLNKPTTPDRATSKERLFDQLLADGHKRTDLEAALFELKTDGLVGVREHVESLPPPDSLLGDIPDGVFLTPLPKGEPRRIAYDIVWPLSALQEQYTNLRKGTGGMAASGAMSDDIDVIVRRAAEEEAQREEARRRESNERVRQGSVWDLFRQLEVFENGSSLPGEEARYADLLIRLCKEARAAGLASGLPDRTANDDGSRLALKVLQLAFAGNGAAISEVLRQVRQAPKTLGRQLVSALLDLLRYEILGRCAPPAGEGAAADQGGQAEGESAPRDQGDTGQPEGGEPSADCAAAQSHQEAPTYTFPPERLDPSRCPGCKAVVPEEHSLLPRVQCLSCGSWELHTGVLVGAVAGPPGTPPVILRHASPYWQPLLPDRQPSRGDMGREEERQQQVAGEGSPHDRGETGGAEGGGTDCSQGPAGQAEETDQPTTSVAAEEAGGLTDRQRSILETMLEHEITSERRRKTREGVVRLINRTHRPQTYSHDFSALVRRGYLQSREGPKGGMWLTLAGRAEAERLRASN